MTLTAIHIFYKLKSRPFGGQNGVYKLKRKVMILDNELINNRPKELYDIEFYTCMPQAPVEFNYKSLPSYLNMDLYTLTGIMPKTKDLIEKTQQAGFFPQPTEKEIAYYRARNCRFQAINVVANIHSFRKLDDNLYSAYPYSISLIAGPKRNRPDECSIELLNSLDLEEISNRRQVYTDFSPFKPVDRGFFADSSFIFGTAAEQYTDTIGFVLETYFLPTNTDITNLPMPGPQNLDPLMREKFRKYRSKIYFKPFDDIKPRRIWGCDSPIELFLVQGLAKRGLFPIIQTMVFKDGSVFANFFDMIKSGAFIKGDELITEVDLYFPEKKLAIFCDSQKFHRGSKNKNKDKLVDIQLADLGIRTLRLPGKQIVGNLNNAVQIVFDNL